MREETYIGEVETVLDRLVAGTISALVLVVTVAFGPLIASINYPDLWFRGHPFFLFSGLHIWGIVVAAVAFGFGVALGPRRMAQLFGHMWGTEEPKNRHLTSGLWLAVAVIIFVSYYLSWTHAL